MDLSKDIKKEWKQELDKSSRCYNSNKNIRYQTFACILNYAENNEYFLLVTFSKWKSVIFLFPAFYECYLNSKFKIIVFDKISFLALHEASQKLIRLTCVAISFLFLLLKFTYSLIISSNTKYQNCVLRYYNNVKNRNMDKTLHVKFSKLSWYHYLDQVISNPVLFKSAKMKALIE